MSNKKFVRTTRHGNKVISNVTDNSFYKPKKHEYTTITEFEVIKPTDVIEKKNERLILSNFGEYCPKNSLRGYALEELLLKPKNYRPIVVIQMGETIVLNHSKTK